MDALTAFFKSQTDFLNLKMDEDGIPLPPQLPFLMPPVPELEHLEATTAMNYRLNAVQILLNKAVASHAGHNHDDASPGHKGLHEQQHHLQEHI